MPGCLSTQLCCRLGAAFHLRLLSALCNDLIEGTVLKAEIQSRVDKADSLHTSHKQFLAAVSLLEPQSTAALGNSRQKCILEQASMPKAEIQAQVDKADSLHTFPKQFPAAVSLLKPNSGQAWRFQGTMQTWTGCGAEGGDPSVQGQGAQGGGRSRKGANSLTGHCRKTRPTAKQLKLHLAAGVQGKAGGEQGAQRGGALAHERCQHKEPCC